MAISKDSKVVHKMKFDGSTYSVSAISRMVGHRVWPIIQHGQLTLIIDMESPETGKSYVELYRGQWVDELGYIAWTVDGLDLKTGRLDYVPVK